VHHVTGTRPHHHHQRRRRRHPRPRHPGMRIDNRSPHRRPRPQPQQPRTLLRQPPRQFPRRPHPPRHLLHNPTPALRVHPRPILLRGKPARLAPHPLTPRQTSRPHDLVGFTPRKPPVPHLPHEPTPRLHPNLRRLINLRLLPQRLQHLREKPLQ